MFKKLLIRYGRWTTDLLPKNTIDYRKNCKL